MIEVDKNTIDNMRDPAWVITATYGEDGDTIGPVTVGISCSESESLYEYVRLDELINDGEEYFGNDPRDAHHIAKQFRVMADRLDVIAAASQCPECGKPISECGPDECES